MAMINLRTPRHPEESAAPPIDLMDLIRQVRRRWRVKVALRGAAGVFALGMAVALASAYVLEVTRFNPTAIIGLRILTAVVWAVLAWTLLIKPTVRRVSDERVALYLEEHEPSLQAALVSAVDSSRAARASGTTGNGSGGSGPSDALVRRLVEKAVERCAAADFGRGLERGELRRYAVALGGAFLVVAAILLLGPAYLRQGASALLFMSQDVEAASPYRIDVKPGNATIPRGSDLTITASLVGFQSDQIELVLRKAPTAPFERLPFVRNNENGPLQARLFHLSSSAEYFVQASGVRSPLFELKVVDLPYVERLELEYRFPDYTGLAPEKNLNGGDIVVLTGTEVRLRAIPTIPSPSGRILLNDTKSVPLTRQQDGSLTASFVVDGDGFYRVELEGPHGERVTASPQYTIDALTDQPPSIVILKPGRDTRVSPLEEAFVQVRATDDYGVRDLRLIYSVNGGTEKTLRLFGGGRSLGEVTAGHTFYLEELGVEPGDFVSYYARAFDETQARSGQGSASDMYFMQVRPFNKDFKPAMSQGGAGGGGDQVGALSEQQRRIISATFNVSRDRKSYTADKLRENAVLIALSQARLREQVEGLVQRMTSRLVEPDSAFDKIAELLPKAVTEMRAAEGQLQARRPDDALAPEQRALQYLQKAEDEYELQVSVSRNAGGGDGGEGSMAEDLADLFDLEMDKLANQYETMERAEQQGADQQLDELMERLKELARRQEQETERQKRRASQGQGGQGGGDSQRALAEQAEEAARRLERLSREESRPDLGDAARRLREAADAMRRAAANGDSSAAAQAASALERLRDAERRVGRSQAARGERDVSDALARAEEIAKDQREISEQVGRLSDADSDKDEQVRRLSERKDALEGKVGELERQLDKTGADLQTSQRDAARKLQEAAGSIRDNKLKEKIRYSKGVMREGSQEQAQSFEEDIESNIASLRDKLGQASAAMGKSEGQALTEALEKARELTRGLESMDQRLRDRAEQGSSESAGAPSSSPGKGQPSQGQSAQGQSAGGQNTGGPREQGGGGEGDTTGPWSPGGGNGSRRPGNFTGEEIRQYRSEMREWGSRGEELRRQLKAQGVDVANLDDILRALRALDTDRVYKDAAELERLQTFVVEGLKRFEYDLRRRIEAGKESLFLSGSDEFPGAYRDLIEEYYRQLSRPRPR